MVLEELGDVHVGDAREHPLLCVVEGEERIRCPAAGCGKSFSRKTNAQRHIRVFHRAECRRLKAELKGLSHQKVRLGFASRRLYSHSA